MKFFKKKFELLQDHYDLKNIFPNCSILATNKRGNYLKDLLVRAGLYNIKRNMIDIEEHGYKRYSKKIDLCDKVELIVKNAPLTLTYVCPSTIETCLKSNHKLIDRQLLYSSNTTSVTIVKNLTVFSSFTDKLLIR